MKAKVVLIVPSRLTLGVCVAIVVILLLLFASQRFPGRVRTPLSYRPAAKRLVIAAKDGQALWRQLATQSSFRPPLAWNSNVTCSDVVADKKCCDGFADFVRPRHRLKPARPVPRFEKCYRILLIIVFNNALYDHAPFLRKLYEPMFPDIALYGPADSPAYNVTGCKRMLVSGRFMHILISQATVEHPGYDGYMWVADDQVFNYKLVLPEKDPTKIWMNVGLDITGNVTGQHIFQVHNLNWHWPSANGLPAVKTAYPCIPKVYLNRSMEYLNCKDCMIGKMSDFGYLPRRFVPDFRVMAFALRKVFLEIAIPTSLALISRSRDDWEVVDRNKTVVYAWGQDRVKPAKKLRPNTRLFHPIKLSGRPKAQDKLMKKLNRLWGLHDQFPSDLPWRPCS